MSTSHTDQMEAWILAPSAQSGPFAAPMFPDHADKRPEFRAARSARDTPEGFVDLPGDGIEDSGNMIALERETAQHFFHRMGLSLRVARTEAPVDSRFSNGLIDPHAITRALRRNTGFSIPLGDIEAILIPFIRWVKPDIHRDPIRCADMMLARQLLALLREGRQAGGCGLLFLPQTIHAPTIKPHG